MRSEASSRSSQMAGRPPVPSRRARFWSPATGICLTPSCFRGWTSSSTSAPHFPAARTMTKWMLGVRERNICNTVGHHHLPLPSGTAPPATRTLGWGNDSGGGIVLGFVHFPPACPPPKEGEGTRAMSSTPVFHLFFTGRWLGRPRRFRVGAIQKVAPQGCTTGFGRTGGADHRGPQPTLVFGENSAVLGALCWCDVLPAAAAEGPSHRAFPTNALGEFEKIQIRFFFAHPCSATRGAAAC